MFFLPVAESIFISSIVAQGFQILSDGLQGLCMVAILLEFIEYYKDKGLGWLRCIIISCCIWGSIGAAFISVYSLIWIAITVFLLEIMYLKENKIRAIEVFKRYYKLLLSVTVPMIIAVVYFKLNHSLRLAYEQFYKFNREVYPQYTDGLGKNLLAPIIESYKNFFSIIADKINAVIVAEATNVAILQLVIIVTATAFIFLMIYKKRYIEAFIYFMVMCCSATRGYSFHGLAAWYIAIMIIVINFEFTLMENRKAVYPVAGIVSVFVLSTYVNIVADNLLFQQKSISGVDEKIIALTDEGEGILIDAYCNDSLYLCYKNRYPVNRAVYMLPWYMDWYEQDTIDDLLNKRPRVAVYNENIETWGYMYYSNAFFNELNEKYRRLSNNPEDGWMYCVWLRNS
ncbi:hypothetical protein [Eisenbergiella sp.]